VTSAGTLAVVGGTGDETVNFSAEVAGTVSLILGDGDNVVDTDNLDDGASVSITMGAGDDEVTLMAAEAEDATIIIDFGIGENTLVFDDDADISDSDVTLTGVDIISLADGEGAGDEAVIGSRAITGKTIELQSVAAAGTFDATLQVLVADGSDFDGGNITMSDSLNTGALGLNIDLVDETDDTTVTGSNGNDTIVIATAAGAGDMTFNGGDGDDTITVGNGDNTINGGKGADAMTGGSGEDIYIFSKATDDNDPSDSAIDSITSFTTGDDTLSTGYAGSTSNFAYVTADESDTEADAEGDANTALDGTVRYAYVIDNGDGDFDLSAVGGDATGADGILYVDWDLDGTADQAILMVGLALTTEFVYADITG